MTEKQLALWKATHNTMLDLLALVLEIRGQPHLIKNNDVFYDNETTYIDNILNNLETLIVEIKNYEKSTN